MFYSHEFLSSREHGVATIWIMATLGSKSGVKKVTKKAILDVDVQKACESIATPKVPMALRLQSNLLYGVSQVYSEQCGYVLLDAHNAHNHLRTLWKTVKAAQLETTSTKARPDQLLLTDDPFFVPDFALPDLDLELRSLQGPTRMSGSSLSPGGGSGSGGAVGGLDFTSDSSMLGGAFAIQGDEGAGSDRPFLPGLSNRDEMEGFDPLADFGFDEEGNLKEPEFEKMAKTPLTDQGGPVGSEVDANANVQARQEFDEGLPGPIVGDQMGVDIPTYDGDIILPEGEPFNPQDGLPTRRDILSSDYVDRSSETLEVQQKRKPKKRIIRLDVATEVRNSEILRWNQDYLQLAAEENKKKLQHKIVLQARKNADWFIWGRGVAGIGNGIGSHALKSPLDIYCGNSLYELITGKSKDGAAGRKRRTEDRGDPDIEGRRVRARTDDGEPGLGGNFGLGDMDDVELPRSAGELGEEHHSSMMPWNMSASVRGSSVSRMQSAFPPSGGPGSVLGRRHRTVSASPLVGRGPSMPLEPLHSLGTDDDLGEVGPYVGHDDNDEFDRYGPAAGVDTQTAAQSQWVRNALDGEGRNFLAFIENTLDEKRDRVAADTQLHGEQPDEEADAIQEVTFEELLPPKNNNRIVAAQGMLHVLGLATKGLINVRQDHHFGEIGMRLVPVVA